MKEALEYLINLYDNDVRIMMSRDKILFRLMDFEDNFKGGIVALHKAMKWFEANEPERVKFRAMELWHHDVINGNPVDPLMEPRCLAFA